MCLALIVLRPSPSVASTLAWPNRAKKPPSGARVCLPRPSPAHTRPPWLGSSKLKALDAWCSHHSATLKASRSSRCSGLQPCG